MTQAYDYTPQLQRLMQLGGLSTFRQLCEKANVSEKQLRRLRRGQIQQMRLETLHQLAEALGVSIVEILETFGMVEKGEEGDSAESALQQEYQRLQTQLEQQRQELWQEFQQASLQTLEPWLLQWSAAAYAAQQNPQAPAVKLLPLLRPIEQLLQQWGIEATATVGSEIPYDPHQHQLMGGMAEPGDLVRVRYAGYRQGDPAEPSGASRLLYRAKVSPL